MKDEIIKFIRFSIVGVFNTSLYYVLYLILLLKFSYNFSATLAWTICVIISYNLNRKFTFNSDNPHKSEIIRFFIISLLQYQVNIICLNFMVYMGLSEKIAGLFAIPFTVVIGFLGHRFFTFKEKWYIYFHIFKPYSIL